MRDDIEKRYHDILFHSETDEDFIAHYGVKGQKHGIRRWQNEDGSLTPEGYRHYGIDPNRMTAKQALKNEQRMVVAEARKHPLGKWFGPLGMAVESVKYKDKYMGIRRDYERNLEQNPDGTYRVKQQTETKSSNGDAFSSAKDIGEGLKAFKRDNFTINFPAKYEKDAHSVYDSIDFDQVKGNLKRAESDTMKDAFVYTVNNGNPKIANDIPNDFKDLYSNANMVVGKNAKGDGVVFITPDEKKSDYIAKKYGVVAYTMLEKNKDGKFGIKTDAPDKETPKETAKSSETDKGKKFDNAKWEKNEAGEWIVDDKYEFNVYKGVSKDKARQIYESMDDELFDKEAVLNALTDFDYAQYYGPDYKKDLSDLIGDKVQIDLLEDKHGIGEDGVYTSLGYVSDKAVDDFVDKYGVFPGVTFLKDKRGRYTLKAASVDYGD